MFGFVLVVAALLLLMRRRDRHHQQLGEELLRLARNQSEVRKVEGAASYQNLSAATVNASSLCPPSRCLLGWEPVCLLR